MEGALLGMGWKRTDDRFSTDFTLKWVELKRQINYREFKEGKKSIGTASTAIVYRLHFIYAYNYMSRMYCTGQQLVNHISNINMLTTKIGLLDSLRDYCQLKGRRAR